MSNFAFFFINGPLLVLNLMTNIFFGFCLMTRNTQQVKQPLVILLGSIVSCTILFELSVTFSTCVLESNIVANITSTIMTFLIHVNTTCNVWLMFYYYLMIVPSQRAIYLWVKKNIKSIIYAMMLFDRLIFLGYASVRSTSIMAYTRVSNGTVFVYDEIEIVFISILNIHIFLCQFFMVIFCFVAAHYLNKHMKSLSASGGSLSNPRFHSQIRVTVTGILQGVLCLLCTLWSLVYGMSYFLLQHFYFDTSILITVVNLYMLASTVNLGVGQTLFRERAVHVWKAVKKRLCTRKS